MQSMSTLTAIVKEGRLVLDEPTTLPEGTKVQLEEADLYWSLEHGDELEDASRQELHASLRRGIAQGHRGEGRPVEEFLADLQD